MTIKLIEGASREALQEALTSVLAIVERHKEVEWESNCPEWANNGNFDDTWADGQDNGESYMANTIQGTIVNALKTSKNVGL